MPTGKFRPCAIRTRNRVNPDCERLGCCTLDVGRFKYCYREEGWFVWFLVFITNHRLVFLAPPIQPVRPTTRAPTTTTVSTTTTRKPTFLEQIRRQNGGTLGGFSLYQMLTMNLKELVSNRTLDKEGS